MQFNTRRVTRLGRAEEAIDPEDAAQIELLLQQKKLYHGRVVWLRCQDQKYYWDGYEKKFVSEDVFVSNRKARARANSEKHRLTPFGRLARSKSCLAKRE